MKYFIFLAIVALGASTASGRLILRHKRQVEREGAPPSEVVVIKDTQGNFPSGPSYGLLPANPNDTDTVELDINEDDGTFNLGGRFPLCCNPDHHHHVQPSFDTMFEMIRRSFDEMTRRMAGSFGSNGGMFPVNPFGMGSGFPGLRPEMDNLPDNYNNTKTEIITIDGKQFVKKTTTIKKGGHGTAIFISSTTYEPVNETENVDRPEIESGSRPEKPISPSSTTSPKDVEESQPDPAPSSSPSSSSQVPEIEREENPTPSPTRGDLA